MDFALICNYYNIPKPGRIPYRNGSNQRDIGMTLRKKTILAIGVVLVLLFVAIFESASIMIRQATHDLEVREAVVNEGRAVDAIYTAIFQLKKSVGDWANWDDSYEFMNDRNKRFLKINMTENAFSSLGVNLIVFVDPSGKMVEGKFFDLEESESQPLPPGLMDELLPEKSIMRHWTDGSSGILMLPDGPMMFAAKPILTSEGMGTPRGLLMMGRWLNKSEIERLSAVTHQQIAIHRFGEAGIPSRPAGVTTSEPNDGAITAYATLTDIEGNPAIVIEVKMPREIAMLGERALASLGFILAGINLVFILLVIFIIDTMVLSRVAALNHDLGDVAASGDVSKRVAARGSDELGMLSESINGMLDSLEHSQNELAQNEKRLDAILNSTQAGFMIIDAESHVIADLNPAAAAMIGLPREEIVGLNCQQFVCPAETGKCPVTDLHQTVDNSERELLAADGRSIPIIKSVSGIIIKGRRYLVESFIDITERKLAEEKIKLAGEELIRTSNMKSELTSMVSHELRTPLAAIKEALAIVLEGMNGPINEQQQRTLGIATRNIDRLVSLTTDVLDFAKLESGKMEMHFANTDLGSLMREIYMSMKPVAEKRGIALSLDLPEKGLLATCDEDRMRQVITNLVTNSLKFTKETGSVKLALERADHKVLIRVSDTGIGIKQEDLPKLFLAFGQIYSKDTVGIKGSGLGLIICKQIVEAHHGTIDVQSVFGEGSTFTIVFPGDLQQS